MSSTYDFWRVASSLSLRLIGLFPLELARQVRGGSLGHLQDPELALICDVGRALVAKVEGAEAPEFNLLDRAIVPRVDNSGAQVRTIRLVRLEVVEHLANVDVTQRRGYEG